MARDDPARNRETEPGAAFRLSENFVRTGAEIGGLLLLFMLGLEYTGDKLKESLRVGFVAGLVDFALNFTPGLMAGLLFGWKPLPCVLLGIDSISGRLSEPDGTENGTTLRPRGKSWSNR